MLLYVPFFAHLHSPFWAVSIHSSRALFCNNILDDMHRIVSMASLFELLGTVKWDDLEGYNARESSVLEYSNSKIMVIMMVRELNKRLKVS